MADKKERVPKWEPWEPWGAGARQPVRSYVYTSNSGKQLRLYFDLQGYHLRVWEPTMHLTNRPEYTKVALKTHNLEEAKAKALLFL